MINKGYIYLHRKIIDNPIVCKDAEHFAIWIYLLLKASHSDREYIFDGKRMTVSRGQLITSRREIADDLHVNESKVQRILKRFNSEQQIEQRTTTVNRIITILNYHKYQDPNKLLNTKRPRVNTYNKGKELKELGEVTQNTGDSTLQAELKANSLALAWWTLWVGKEVAGIGMPTPTEISNIHRYALSYNKDVEYWRPFLVERMRRKTKGEFHHTSVKSFATEGFRSYEAERPGGPQKIDLTIYKTDTLGYFRAYCHKCGKHDYYDKFDLYKKETKCKCSTFPYPEPHIEGTDQNAGTHTGT